MPKTQSETLAFEIPTGPAGTAEIIDVIDVALKALETPVIAKDDNTRTAISILHQVAPYLTQARKYAAGEVPVPTGRPGGAF